MLIYCPHTKTSKTITSACILKVAGDEKGKSHTFITWARDILSYVCTNTERALTTNIFSYFNKLFTPQYAQNEIGKGEYPC